MASEAMIGMGTKFQREDGAGSFEDVAEVYGISGPNMSRETVEVTHYGSEGGYREHIGGLREPGTVSFTLNFVKSTYESMKADFEEDNNKTYRIVLPNDEMTLEFDAMVTELPLEIPEGDRITAEITMQISGAVQVDPTE